MKKQLAAFMAATMMMGTLAACGGSGDKAGSKHYTVGICKLCR